MVIVAPDGSQPNTVPESGTNVPRLPRPPPSRSPAKIQNQAASLRRHAAAAIAVGTNRSGVVTSVGASFGMRYTPVSFATYRYSASTLSAPPSEDASVTGLQRPAMHA